MKRFLKEVLPEEEERNEDSLIEGKGDHKISIKDTETSQNNESKKKINFDKLVDIVFEEILSGDTRNYLDLDDFSKVLWCTTIDKTCVIDLKE
jgi:hypothetical protein